jgi:hypothetical protein
MSDREVERGGQMAAMQELTESQEFGRGFPQLQSIEFGKGFPQAQPQQLGRWGRPIAQEFGKTWPQSERLEFGRGWPFIDQGWRSPREVPPSASRTSIH